MPDLSPSQQAAFEKWFDAYSLQNYPVQMYGTEDMSAAFAAGVACGAAQRPEMVDAVRLVAIMLKKMGVEVLIEPDDILSIEGCTLHRWERPDGRGIHYRLEAPTKQSAERIGQEPTK